MHTIRMHTIRFILTSVLSGQRTQQANASVRAAFVHVVGDLLQSISVLISAFIIYFKVSDGWSCWKPYGVKHPER